MRKVRLFIFALALFMIIPLSSCDLTILLKDSTKTQEEESKTEPDKTKTDDKTKTEDDEKEPDPVLEIDEYDLSIYLDDYQEKYGYLALANDLEHGELMQSAYKDFYDASKALLLSKEDKEISTMETTQGSVNYLEVLQTDYFENQDDIQYYTSAWSVFVSDNPIFYFLTNGVLTRSKVTTTTKKDSQGKITEQTDVTTYAFILVGNVNYVTFDARDIINKKLINLFESTKDIALLENDALKTKAINDYLKENLTYAYKENTKIPEDSYWAHNILGLLDNKKGVCECYSKSFKLLADHYDITSIQIYGVTDTGEAHAWNNVLIDESWYGLDVTWNDNEYSKDKYLLCSNTVIAKEHFPYNTVYGITYQPSSPVLATDDYQFE